MQYRVQLRDGGFIDLEADQIKLEHGSYVLWEKAQGVNVAVFPSDLVESIVPQYSASDWKVRPTGGGAFTA